VVAELQKLFIATWQSQKGSALAPRNYFPPPEKAGSEVVRAIGSSPDEPFSQICRCCPPSPAQTSVLLTNAYFAPDP
jgi:cardiolipin synthase